MQIFLILALLIAIVAVVFAVQNPTIVTITFVTWSLHTSLAVALLVALGAGVLITLLVSIPGRVKGSWSSASQKKKHSLLEAEHSRLQQKLDEMALDRDKYLKKWEDAELEITNLEQQTANLSGALEGMEPSAGVQPEPTQPMPKVTGEDVPSSAESEPPSNQPEG
jgi:uncharacterized integral membrane protein